MLTPRNTRSLTARGTAALFPSLAVLAPATAEGIQATQRRATLVRELFGRYYAKNPAAEDVFAFQVAIWELTMEPEPANNEPAKFDLFAGDFQADYPKDMAPAFVLKAQK